MNLVWGKYILNLGGLVCKVDGFSWVGGDGDFYCFLVFLIL